jgi:ABC-type sugar transport system permease subunit
VSGGAEAPGAIAFRRLPRSDRRVVVAFVGVAAVVQLALIWLPALASVALSLTDWNGIGGLDAIRFVGLANYRALLLDAPTFWSAIANNGLWLVAYLGIATPIGLLLAVSLDRQLRGARLYQAAIYLPAVLALALVGFIWQLQYSPDQGFLDAVLGRTPATTIDWLGDRSINRLAVLVPAIWRHVGTVTVLYLAGLRTIDPSLRAAAAIDGAGEWQTLRHVLLPALRPFTTLVLVVGAIDGLRSFDLVYVLNGGLNGLELLATLVTATITGPASRVGMGSAIATVLLALSLPPILLLIRRRARAEAT